MVLSIIDRFFLKQVTLFLHAKRWKGKKGICDEHHENIKESDSRNTFEIIPIPGLISVLKDLLFVIFYADMYD